MRLAVGMERDYSRLRVETPVVGRDLFRHSRQMKNIGVATLPEKESHPLAQSEIVLVHPFAADPALLLDHIPYAEKSKVVNA